METNLTTYTYMQNLRLEGKNLGGNLTGYTCMQNMRLEVQKNTISLDSYIIEKLWSFRIQNVKLRAILIIYTSMQNLKLKQKLP